MNTEWEATWEAAREAHALLHRALVALESEALHDYSPPNYVAVTLLARAAWHVIEIEEPYRMLYQTEETKR